MIKISTKWILKFHKLSLEGIKIYVNRRYSVIFKGKKILKRMMGWEIKDRFKKRKRKREQKEELIM